MTSQQETLLVTALREFTLQVDRFVEVFATAHGLHRTDLDALAHLWQAETRRQPLTPGRLAEALSLSGPATSALLHRLERAGHVQRERDPADGRRSLLRMSGPAQDLALAFFQPLGRRLREAMTGFDEAELRTAERFVRAVTAAAGAAADDAAGRAPGGTPGGAAGRAAEGPG